MRGFVSKSRYIISVSGIALILESRDSSALFLLYGDIYNKYMYINQQKNQDQKGKVTQTDTICHMVQLLGHCHTFGMEMASKMSIYLSLGVKHKLLSVIITTPSANLNPIMECKQGAPFSKRDKIQVLQRNIFPK